MWSFMYTMTILILCFAMELPCYSQMPNGAAKDRELCPMVLDGLADDDLSGKSIVWPRQLIDKIVNSDFEYNSEQSAVGQLERAVVVHKAKSAKPDAVLRSLHQWENDGRGMVLLNQYGAAYLGIFDELAFAMGRNGLWKQTPGYWSLQSDGQVPLGKCLVVGSQPSEQNAQVLFDLPALTRRHLSSSTNEGIWSKECSSLVIMDPNDNLMRIRLRTPNDTLRFGTDLSEVAIHDQAANTTFGWTRFGCQQASSDMFFRLKRPEAIARELDETCLPFNDEFDWSELRSFDIPSSENSQHFCRVIGLSDAPRYQETKDWRAYYDQADTRLKFLLAGLYAKEIWNLEELDGYSRCVSETYSLLSWVIDYRYISRGEILGVDDEAILWKDAEKLTSAIEMWRMVTNAKALAAVEGLGHGQRIGVLAKLAELGHPPFDGNGHEFSSEFEDPFVEAVFRARWQWPCQEKHVNACLDVLRIYKSETLQSQVATDTLVRLDMIDSIPQREWGIWFNDHIVNAESKAHCMRHLTLLSSHESGQEVLMYRLAHMKDPEHIVERIKEVLQERLNSVRQTSRYDFMSKEVCDKVSVLLKRG